MNTLNQSATEIRQKTRPRIGLLAPILAVSLVLVWAIGAHTAPASSTDVSGKAAASTGTFLSPPDPFMSPLLTGHVALERRGLSGDPLTRRPRGGRSTNGIQIYQPGSSTVLARTGRPPMQPAHPAALDGLSSVYDIRIKGGDTLSVKKAGVVPASVDFGTLLVGDGTATTRSTPTTCLT
jgi:hypothetical protein